ncbi:MAG: methionyl aminopeptidase [Firmicutes bacterium]|nr:methionyl aminopeptidase [Bacillota bacterium]
MKLNPNDVCWCGSGRKYKKCHMMQDEKMQIFRDRRCLVPDVKLLKTPAQVEGMKASAAVNMAALDAVAEKICAGMSTEDINTIVHDVTTKMGAIPAPLGYEGFPKSVCTSINDEVCHGIPDPGRILKDGDIINVDVSTILNGYYSDSSRMFMIGDVSPERRRLVEVTKECVEKGLEQVKPWGFLGDIGAAVNEHAKKNGYSVVREIGGHGIGLDFHEDPWVSFVSKRETGMVLVPGLCFTIEPMVNMGRHGIFCDEENGWTIYTRDGKPSAQWEVQVLVTEKGYELIAW